GRYSSPADAVSISRGDKGSTSPRDRTSTTTHAFRSSHFRRFWPAAGDYAARPEASGASWRHSETVGHRATLRFGPGSSVDRAAVRATPCGLKWPGFGVSRRWPRWSWQLLAVIGSQSGLFAS